MFISHKAIHVISDKVRWSLELSTDDGVLLASNILGLLSNQDITRELLALLEAYVFGERLSNK